MAGSEKRDRFGWLFDGRIGNARSEFVRFLADSVARPFRVRPEYREKQPAVAQPAGDPNRPQVIAITDDVSDLAKGNTELDTILREHGEDINRLRALFPDEHLGAAERGTVGWLVSAIERTALLPERSPELHDLYGFEHKGTSYNALDILTNEQRLRDSLGALAKQISEKEYADAHRAIDILEGRFEQAVRSDDATEQAQIEPLLRYMRQRRDDVSRALTSLYGAIRYIGDETKRPLLGAARQQDRVISDWKSELGHLRLQIGQEVSFMNAEKDVVSGSFPFELDFTSRDRQQVGRILELLRNRNREEIDALRSGTAPFDQRTAGIPLEELGVWQRAAEDRYIRELILPDASCTETAGWLILDPRALHGRVGERLREIAKLQIEIMNAASSPQELEQERQRVTERSHSGEPFRPDDFDESRARSQAYSSPDYQQLEAEKQLLTNYLHHRDRLSMDELDEIITRFRPEEPVGHDALSRGIRIWEAVGVFRREARDREYVLQEVLLPHEPRPEVVDRDRRQRMRGAFPLLAQESLERQGIDAFLETRGIELATEDVERRLSDTSGRMAGYHTSQGRPGAYLHERPEQSALEQVTSAIGQDVVLTYLDDGNVSLNLNVARIQAIQDAAERSRRARAAFLDVVRPGRDMPLGGAYYSIVDVTEGTAADISESIERLRSGREAANRLTVGISLDDLPHWQRAAEDRFILSGAVIDRSLFSVFRRRAIASLSDVDRRLADTLGLRGPGGPSAVALAEQRVEQLANIERRAEAYLGPLRGDEELSRSEIDERGKALMGAIGGTRYERMPLHRVPEATRSQRIELEDIIAERKLLARYLNDPSSLTSEEMAIVTRAFGPTEPIWYDAGTRGFDPRGALFAFESERIARTQLINRLTEYQKAAGGPGRGAQAFVFLRRMPSTLNPRDSVQLTLEWASGKQDELTEFLDEWSRSTLSISDEAREAMEETPALAAIAPHFETVVRMNDAIKAYATVQAGDSQEISGFRLFGDKSIKLPFARFFAHKEEETRPDAVMTPLQALDAMLGKDKKVAASVIESDAGFELLNELKAEGVTDSGVLPTAAAMRMAIRAYGAGVFHGMGVEQKQDFAQAFVEVLTRRLQTGDLGRLDLSGLSDVGGYAQLSEAFAQFMGQEDMLTEVWRAYGGKRGHAASWSAAELHAVQSSALGALNRALEAQYGLSIAEMSSEQLASIISGLAFSTGGQGSRIVQRLARLVAEGRIDQVRGEFARYEMTPLSFESAEEAGWRAHLERQAIRESDDGSDELQPSDLLIDVSGEPLTELERRAQTAVTDRPLQQRLIAQLQALAGRPGAAVTPVANKDGAVIGYRLEAPAADLAQLQEMLSVWHKTIIEDASGMPSDMIKMTQSVGGREIEILPNGAIRFVDTGEVVSTGGQTIVHVVSDYAAFDYPIVIGGGETPESGYQIEMGKEIPIMRRFDAPAGRMRTAGGESHRFIMPYGAARREVPEFLEPGMMIRAVGRYTDGELAENVATMAFDTETLGLVTDSDHQVFDILQVAITEQKGVNAKTEPKSYIVLMSQEGKDAVERMLAEVDAGNINNLDDKQITMLSTIAKFGQRFDPRGGTFSRREPNVWAVRLGMRAFDNPDAEMRAVIEAKGDTIVTRREAAEKILEAIGRNELVIGQSVSYDLATSAWIMRQEGVLHGDTDFYQLLAGKDVIDTLALGRFQMPDSPSFELGDLGAAYGLKVEEGKLHFAEYDTKLSMDVVQRQLALSNSILEDTDHPYASYVDLKHMRAGDILQATMGLSGERVYSSNVYQILNVDFESFEEEEQALANQLRPGSMASAVLREIGPDGTPSNQLLRLTGKAYGALEQVMSEAFDVIRYQTEEGQWAGVSEEEVARRANRAYMESTRRQYERATLDNVVGAHTLTITRRDGTQIKHLPGKYYYDLVRAAVAQSEGRLSLEELDPQVREIWRTVSEREAAQMVAASPRMFQDEQLFAEARQILEEYTSSGELSTADASRLMQQFAAELWEVVDPRDTYELLPQEYRVPLVMDVTMPRPDDTGEPQWEHVDLMFGSPGDIYRSTAIILSRRAREYQRDYGVDEDVAKGFAMQRFKESLRRVGLFEDADEEEIMRLVEADAARLDAHGAREDEAARERVRGYYRHSRDRIRSKLEPLSDEYLKLHARVVAKEVLPNKEQQRYEELSGIVQTEVAADFLRPRTAEEMERLRKVLPEHVSALRVHAQVYSRLHEIQEAIGKISPDYETSARSLAEALRTLMFGNPTALTEEQLQTLVGLVGGNIQGVSPGTMAMLEALLQELQTTRGELVRDLNLTSLQEAIEEGTIVPPGAEERPVNLSSWDRIRSTGRLIWGFASPFVLRAGLHALGAFINNAALPYDMRVGDRAPASDGVFDAPMRGPAYHQMLPRPFMAPEGGVGYTGIRFRVQGTASSRLAREQLQQAVASAVRSSVPVQVQTSTNLRDNSYKIDQQWLDARYAELIG